MTSNLRGPNTVARRAVINTAWDLAPKKLIRAADIDEASP